MKEQIFLEREAACVSVIGTQPPSAPLITAVVVIMAIDDPPLLLSQTWLNSGGRLECDSLETAECETERQKLASCQNRFEAAPKIEMGHIL